MPDAVGGREYWNGAACCIAGLMAARAGCMSCCAPTAAPTGPTCCGCMMVAPGAVNCCCEGSIAGGTPAPFEGAPAMKQEHRCVRRNDQLGNPHSINSQMKHSPYLIDPLFSMSIEEFNAHFRF